MKVLTHHIYEYKKGLRNLVLHTMSSSYRLEAERCLRRNQIDFIIREVGNSKINIFFGSDACVQVIREMGNKSLTEFTPEEDFILGIMLGYDRLRQCDRFLERKSKTLPNLQQMLLCS